jgi:hypothetical protein
MVKTLDNETLGGPQQIVFLAYHKLKLSTEISPQSNRSYPVSGSVEIITKFERVYFLHTFEGKLLMRLG